jgi:DNA-binding LytR/AlgR family response regulator
MTLFLTIGELAGSVAGLPFTEVLRADFGNQLIVIASLICLAHLASVAGQKPPAEPVGAPRHFTVRDAGGFRLVRPQEIIWADAQGNYARLHTASGRHLIRTTMAGLEQSLDPAAFVRIHRGMIVNADQIARIERHGHGTYRLSLADGSELRSARSYSDRIARLLG